MKPSFALNLSHDGISLLHRAQSGWLSVGDVPLESPTLMDELVVLRRTAADLDAQGLSTKLVIPNSQIQYLDVEAPGPTRAERVVQIEAALAQKTGYHPDEMAFDWHAKDKDLVQVAVVARSTMAEAEQFAASYRFNPVSFVAIPPNGAFEGEPFFGLTDHAKRLHGDEANVERDTRRITIVGQLGDVIASGPHVNGHAGDAGLNGHAVNGHGHSEDAGPDGTGREDEGAEPSVSPETGPETAPENHGDPVSFVTKRAAPETPKLQPKATKVAIEDLPPPEPAQVDASLPNMADLPPRLSSPRNGAEALPPITARGGNAPPVSRLNGAAPSDRLSTPLPNGRDVAHTAEPHLDTAREAALAAGDTSFKAKRSQGGGIKLSEALARIKSRTLGVWAGDGAAPAPDAAPAKDAAASTALGKSTLLANPDAPTLPKPKLVPRAKVAIAQQAKAPGQAPDTAKATPKDGLATFGASAQPSSRERSRSFGPFITAGVVVALIAIALFSTYWLNRASDDLFGIGSGAEVTEIAEPPPLILPGDGAGAVAGVESGAVESGVGDDAAPSVPLPGLAVTDLQPGAVDAPPVPGQPEPGTVDEVLTPNAEGALPDVLADGDDVGVPDLPGAGDEPVELALTLTPPVAPEAPPAPLDTDLVAAPPPNTDAAPDAAPGPEGDIATSGPAQPALNSAPGEAGGLPESSAAPGTMELVRLPDPSAPEAFPQVGVEAPLLVRPGLEPPPTEDEALAFYERTGISVLAPPRLTSPSSDRLSELVTSEADLALSDPKPRGLASAEDFDLSPGVLRGLVPPLPLDYTFDLDERGLVRPTPEGALSPGGVLVYPGAPAIVPPVRPNNAPEDDARAVPGPDSDTPEGESDVASADGDATPDIEDNFDLVDTEAGLAALLDAGEVAEAEERVRFSGLTLDELAERRPTLRPNGIEAVAEAEADVDPDADPETGVQVASLTPDGDVPPGSVGVAALSGETGVSPDSVVPTVGDTTPGATDLSALDADALPSPDAETVAEDEDSATELAVTASLTPPNRPAGLVPPEPEAEAEATGGGETVDGALVDSALAEANAVAPPSSGPGDNVTINVPNIPTTAEVSSAATEENALRLNRVNLIGVYGSAEDRRALVRLSSGRYVKVQVGDTVDRGRVVAIGDTALRYVRGGRTITLELPNG
ncbi:MAG: hypothetical protein AAF748_01530 [Pseudomonadota bacterium]